MRHTAIILCLCAAMLCAQAARPANISDGDWPMYNRDLAGTRYSPLTQINTGNVTKLDQVWSYRLRTEEERKQSASESRRFF